MFVDISVQSSYTQSGLNNKFIAEINPFRYRSYYYDTETNLYYLNSRYYDPEISRFINADDIEYLNKNISNGLNLYAYCLDNPIKFRDIFGNNIFTDALNFIKGLFGTVRDFVVDTANSISTAINSIIGGKTNKFDLGFIVFESGFQSELNLINGNKPITLYLTTATKWWKIWEYRIGLSINLKNFNADINFGITGVDFSLGDSNSSFDLFFNIDKLGFGISTSKTIGNVINKSYNQVYIRPLIITFATTIVYDFNKIFNIFIPTIT